YGFIDAFNPNNGWTNPDVIGIDVGITLLSAENLRTGNVWRWFMRNGEITRAMDLVGLRPRAKRRHKLVGAGLVPALGAAGGTRAGTSPAPTDLR
ncbi:MAG TPA: glucoamylase family protein, partial [Pyrinomonadaceae bacterium]|nr:glucoamylase family protein [Pyrinomonadaceae bacterium]